MKFATMFYFHASKSVQPLEFVDVVPWRSLGVLCALGVAAPASVVPCLNIGWGRWVGLLVLGRGSR